MIIITDDSHDDWPVFLTLPKFGNLRGKLGVVEHEIKKPLPRLSENCLFPGVECSLSFERGTFSFLPFHLKL